MINFRTPKKTFGGVDAAQAAQLVTACSDIAVVLDRKGIIRDLASDNDELAAAGCSEWIGRPWSDTVTVESRPKIDELISDAETSAHARWRQVNHPIAGRSDLPVRYCTVRLGLEGRIIAIGRDLRAVGALQERLVRAEQQLEREYARLRSLETRYRSLFQLSAEAVMIVDSSTLKVVEANPAAVTMLANGSRRAVGRQLAELVAPASVPALEALLASVRATPRADEIEVSTAFSKRAMRLSASLFRQDAHTYFLVRLSPLRADSSEGAASTRSLTLGVMEYLPDGLVVIGEDRRVLSANAAFLELVGLTAEEQVRGESIGRWLGRVDLDADILFASLREHGAVRHFLTVVRAEYGGQADVDVSAVTVPQGPLPCIGLSIRRAQREPIGLDKSTRGLPRSMQQLTELVGRVPLKDLVRETTDIIERMCIEAALELTADNRASAAEMLGLSRQSLYVKLRRHGMGDLDGEVE